MWTTQEGVASLGGMLYSFTSLSACLQLCLEMSTCLAVDHTTADNCFVHTDINYTASTFVDPSSTQYTLNKACLLFTRTSASSTATTLVSITTSKNVSTQTSEGTFFRSF